MIRNIRIYMPTKRERASIANFFLQSWIGKRVKHRDDDMKGFVVSLKDGHLRICWDDDSVDLQDPNNGYLQIVNE